MIKKGKGDAAEGSWSSSESDNITIEDNVKTKGKSGKEQWAIELLVPNVTPESDSEIIDSWN